MKSALTYRNVTIRYQADAQPAIDDISLTIEAGERVALLGLNGSGKTTLLNAVAGLIKFTGEITVDGIELTKKTARSIRDHLGYLFCNPDDQLIFPNVLDDVAYSFERRGIAREEACKQAMRLLSKLKVDRYAAESPNTLSHGERQRVALAGVLAFNPGLLLLDEPSAALDIVGRAELITLLNQQNAAMLIATHDRNFAASLCNRFLILDAGKIISDTRSIEAALEYEQLLIRNLNSLD